MKKFKNIIKMLHHFQSYSFGSERSKGIMPVRFDGNIDVDIVLGNPTKDCQHHGICKINRSSNLGHVEFMNSKTYLKNSLKAVLQMDKDKNLIIKLDCKTLTPFIKNKYFIGDYFIISAPLDIPYFVSSYFGTSFKIKKGLYPIDKGTDYYQILIKP